MIDFVGKRNLWFIISGATMGLSILFLLMWGLVQGIDFTGGTLVEYKFAAERPTPHEVEVAVEENFDYGEIIVQPVEEDAMSLKLKELTNEDREGLREFMVNEFGELEERSFESIGPTIGDELKQKAMLALTLVLVFIVLYLAYAFRNTKGQISPWVLGGAAIIALIHDVLITAGVFSLLGELKGYEVDTLFVTALLAVLGFSVNDTIVTFDRVRENLKEMKGESFGKIVNASINQTLVRSLNTSITTLVVLVVLFFFGSASLQHFILALIVGIAAGTYSSIFIAAPLLVEWVNRTGKRQA